MQGQTEALTDTDAVQNGYEYRFLSDRLVPLRNPVGEDITAAYAAGFPFEQGVDLREWQARHVAGSACYGNTNLVPEFCRAYIAKTRRTVAAVHVAKGSTVIADWLPGSAGYEILRKKARAAIKKIAEQHSIGSIYFVWLQGESDAINGCSAAEYQQKCGLLCDALKRDLSIDRFCIIRVGRFTNDGRDDAIHAAQDALCAVREDFWMLTDRAAKLCGQADCMNPYVKGHFSARGLELLGREAGEQLGKYAK